MAGEAGEGIDVGRFIVQRLEARHRAGGYHSERGDSVPGFSPEDQSSNAAGAQFGDDYLDENGSAEAVLQEWLRDAGALADEAPSAHRDKLPETDPSVRPKDDSEKRWWQFWR